MLPTGKYLKCPNCHIIHAETDCIVYDPYCSADCCKEHVRRTWNKREDVLTPKDDTKEDTSTEIDWDVH